MKRLSIPIAILFLAMLGHAQAENVELGGSVQVGGDINVNGRYAIGGHQVLHQDRTNNNLFLGSDAGRDAKAAEGNTYLGVECGSLNGLGSWNTYVGNVAGLGAKTQPDVQADGNVFMGYAAGRNLVDGDDNVAVGYQSAVMIRSGRQNVLIGSEAARELTDGYDNVIIGYRAGQGDSGAKTPVPVTGLSNILVGSYSGQDMGNGMENVFVGHRSGEDNTTGSGNVYLGTAAGWYNKTGNGNVFIGQKAGGDETLTEASNQLFIDNSDTLSPLIWGDFAADRVEINGSLWVDGTVGGLGGPCCPSDIRLKENIVPMENVLAKVTALNGVRFEWRAGTRAARSAAGGRPQIGVVAQEVEKVFPELVGEDPHGYKTVDYQKMIAPLIQAIKELRAEKDREIEALKADKDREIEALKARLQRLENRPG